jgi:hypothetical protein
VFEEWLEENKSKYRLETYSLFSHNCNNFSQEAVSFLTGKNIPECIPSLSHHSSQFWIVRVRTYVIFHFLIFDCLLMQILLMQINVMGFRYFEFTK